MKAIITFKLTPESKEEAIQSFAASYRDFRAMIELANSKGAFGLAPDHVELRWMVETGRWE